MCWWWLKKTSNVDYPTVPTPSKWVADVVTELPSVNSSSGPGIHYLCRPPSEPCSNASRKVIQNYCVHGVCCTSIADEYCACFSANFYGDRCENPEVQIKSSQMIENADDSCAAGWAMIAAAGVAAVILVIVIMLLIRYIKKTRSAETHLATPSIDTASSKTSNLLTALDLTDFEDVSVPEHEEDVSCV